jgi:Domain of unknown function (DUF4824)
VKQGSLLGAAAVLLASNGLVLMHAWQNRSGPVESEIILTERELSVPYAIDEDSGVSFNLRWIDPNQWSPLYNSLRWLDEKTLHQLGFDTSVAPSAESALEFYQRQRSRRAFVALEYDGPAWRKWIDEFEDKVQRQSPPANVSQRETSTRLVAIDAATDAALLRARHPDRGSVIIVPAIIRIGIEPQGANRSPHVYGAIQEIPSTIHVPPPFSDSFRRLPRKRDDTKYRVHLRYGRFLEPWIVGVEFPSAGR